MADVGDYALTETGSVQATWTEAEWEAAWAPYDETTYRAALEFIRPDDTVLDIGAGDLRFARRAAQRARAVIAIERQAALLTGPHPANLTVICGDALSLLYPSGVTVAVLLMRHCQHFADTVRRLRGVGCRQLITNARWGMGVESVSLVPRMTFAAASTGWYACLCGAVGFKPGPPKKLTPALLARVTHVGSCPACRATHDDRATRKDTESTLRPSSKDRLTPKGRSRSANASGTA